MTKENIKVKKGFTIIEVVLVLAIAGLIFLMVFVALPALQRSQRDTGRRDDMARVVSQISQFQANNRNRIPGESELTDFKTNYMSANGEDVFQDPDGSEYTFKYCTSNDSSGGCKPDTALTTFDHVIYYSPGYRCDGERLVQSTGGNKVAVRYKLEGAGTYCGSN